MMYYSVYTHIVCAATTDYQSLISIPLVFPAGSRAGNTQSFSVSIVDDADVEGSEQFSLTIIDNTTTAQSVSLRSMETIAIIDNDFGRCKCIYMYVGSDSNMLDQL